jgi:hypothetical protein
MFQVACLFRHAALRLLDHRQCACWIAAPPLEQSRASD